MPANPMLVDSEQVEQAAVVGAKIGAAVGKGAGKAGVAAGKASKRAANEGKAAYKKRQEEKRNAVSVCLPGRHCCCVWRGPRAQPLTAGPALYASLICRRRLPTRCSTMSCPSLTLTIATVRTTCTSALSRRRRYAAVIAVGREGVLMLSTVLCLFAFSAGRAAAR
jgi:hypothetical protein|eukprot:COSAG06_NODE_2394_length_6958_cov_4.596151_9_plen_166_part_00